MNNRILHITWKNNDLSEKQKFILKRWSLLNPNLEIKYYTDDINEKFVKSFYPEYEPILSRFERVVMKLDFIRLLYIYQYGGIYSDFDVLPLKSIESLLDLNEVVICKEDEKNAKNFNIDYILSNAVIIAKPKSGFIKYLIEDIVSNIDSPKINSKNPNDILEMTGPLFFSRAYSDYNNKSSITILDSLYFNPMTFYEISKGEIKNNIEFSYLIHLYDGTWWQEEHNSSMEYLNKLIRIHDALILKYFNNYKHAFKKYKENNFTVDLPKISCLCVTKNKEHILRESIISYQNQIYKNKELIVLYEDDNKYMDGIIKNFNSKDIKYIKISTENKKSLGELRNISIKESSGEYVCQWDDDDWYHPLRVWEQFRHMKLNNKKGSILSSWMVYDNVKDNLLECKRLSLLGWEGSFLYEKSSLQHLYPSIARGEDTVFIEKIESDLAVLYKPELYVYRVHSNNTWGYDNLYNRIIKYSKDYNGTLDFNFLKNNNLSSFDDIFGEVIINNEKFEFVKYKDIQKTYYIGIVVSVNGNYNELKNMLDSLNNISVKKDILLIILDNSVSSGNDYPCQKSKQLILEYDFKNFNNIKIFKKYYSDIQRDYKTGFDILKNDFDCEYFMSIDSSVILSKKFINNLFEPILLQKIQNRLHLLNGFTKNYLGDDSCIKSEAKGYHKFIKKLEDYNLAFKSSFYNEIRDFYNKENYLTEISNYATKKSALIYCPYNSLINLQINKNNDVPYGFYYDFEDIKYIAEEYKSKSKIPPLVHIPFLFEENNLEEFKLKAEKFKENSLGLYTVLWRESDVLRLMTYEEIDVYTNYIHDIEKYEYAKYIILKYMGGINFDLNIEPKKDINELYLKNNDVEEVFVEGEDLKADYILMSKANSKIIKDILEICKQRSGIKIRRNLDASKKVGSSVVNEVFCKNKKTKKTLSGEVYSDFFKKRKEIQWGDLTKTNDDLKISVVMQSYLGDYPGSRSNPEPKFIRAVNSFLNQSNKNSELVIISDNCKITEKLYNENFSKNSRIKFKLCEKKGKKMYEKDSGTIHFVGEPRQRGVDMCDGEIITYMDSDDILTDVYLEKLIEYWKYNYNLDWIINRCWWDNVKAISKEGVRGYDDLFDRQLTDESQAIKGLDSKWIKSYVRRDFILQSPGLISHKKTCDVKWSDVSSVGNLSEDILFYKEMLEKYKKGKQIHLFGYVRCHLKGGWDF